MKKIKKKSKKIKTKTRTKVKKKIKKHSKSIKKKVKKIKSKVKSRVKKKIKIIKNKKVAIKQNFIFKIINFQNSLKPQINFKINFSVEKYIQAFFDKIANTIFEYKFKLKKNNT